MASKKQSRPTPFRMQVMVSSEPCFRCGDMIAKRAFGTECRNHVEGTAGTRLRSIKWLCEECSAAGEYQQHLLREQQRAELFASLSDDELAGYLARKAAARS